MRKLVFARRISQIFFLTLFVYILWSTTYPLHGFISPQIFFKIDPLLMFFTALSRRLLLPGLLFGGAMLLLTLALGRFFCGWVCPMGTVIDGCGVLNKHRKQLADSVNQKLRQPKFFILAITAVLAIFGIQAAWALDPIVIAGRVVSLNIIPSVTLAVDKSFQFVIQRFGLYGGVYDFYRELKNGFLAVNVHFFANALVTFFLFLGICISAFFIARLWCRMLCPLGALYAVFSRRAWLERKVDKCTACGKCRRHCRTGAIIAGADYRKGECVLCMDCVYDCPERSTRFDFRRVRGEGRGAREEVDRMKGGQGISRGHFLFLAFSAFSFLGFKPSTSDQRPTPGVIRPPGALPESQFVDVCVRCGNCMKVCPTNGLQPVMLESGAEGIWTPRLVPEIGYCEYNCKLCGEVCPTQAIRDLPLARKQKTPIGLAVIDQNICWAWAEKKECLVCQEHCPVPEKAIKIQEDIIGARKIQYPIVDKSLCIGCGICQNKCPARPGRAIKVIKD